MTNANGNPRLQQLCPACGGSGRVGIQDNRARGRKGGNAVYLNSEKPGRPSMAQRGKRGGGQPMPTWEDLQRTKEKDG